MNRNNLPKIISIVGTNASGKSGLGIRLAQRFDGEIVCADSRQINVGFDLCCGKVSGEERKLVRHHMLDVCEVDEDYSVSDFKRDASACIDRILGQGKLPLVVGGTGLYVNALVQGYEFEEEDYNPAYRAELEAMTVRQLQELLPAEGTEKLRNNRSDFHNKRRLVRALEKLRNGESLQPTNAARYNALQIGVTWPKELLDERIDERLARRLEQGMLDEVRDYLKAGRDPEVMIRLGLEYRYITWYLQGRYASYEAFRGALALAIKQFAKRQITWFKKDPAIRWIDMTGDGFAEACRLIEAFLA
jgi:tRNA dimethylallyltransferase